MEQAKSYPMSSCRGIAEQRPRADKRNCARYSLRSPSRKEYDRTPDIHGAPQQRYLADSLLWVASVYATSDFESSHSKTNLPSIFWTSLCTSKGSKTSSCRCSPPTG